MTRYRIEVIGSPDEVLVHTSRDKEFFDEAGFHPRGEARELRRYLYWLIEQVMNDLTDEGGGE